MRLQEVLGLGANKLPILLCIGTDRVTGDCFGPLVGTKLLERFNINTFVYGSLSRPVTALNILETVAFIKLKHPHHTILAVDSSLGKVTDIGKIRIIADGIYPGAATGKNLPKVGDFSITATVAPMGDSSLLYGVKLGLVNSLANTTAEAIAQAIKELDLIAV